MVIWGIVTFGFDSYKYFILEELCSEESVAKEKIKEPSTLPMDFPHRNIRGYLRMEVDKPTEYSWDDVSVADKDKLKKIKAMIRGL